MDLTTNETPYTSETAWEECFGHLPAEPAPLPLLDEEEPLDGDFSDGDALVACPPDYIREEYGL